MKRAHLITLTLISSYSIVTAADTNIKQVADTHKHVIADNQNFTFHTNQQTGYLDIVLADDKAPVERRNAMTSAQDIEEVQRTRRRIVKQLAYEGKTHEKLIIRPGQEPLLLNNNEKPAHKKTGGIREEARRQAFKKKYFPCCTIS